MLFPYFYGYDHFLPLCRGRRDQFLYVLWQKQDDLLYRFNTSTISKQEEELLNLIEETIDNIVDGKLSRFF